MRTGNSGIAPQGPPSQRSGPRSIKRASDMSGAEIDDNMSASDDDSPRRGGARSGSGIATGMNPSVVTLGAKRGGASVPGTGLNTNESHVRGAGGLSK